MTVCPCGLSKKKPRAKYWCTIPWFHQKPEEGFGEPESDWCSG